jgi:hypothetical protein
MCVHAYILTYTYVHTYIHTYIHTHIPTYIRTYIHTYIYTYVYIYIRTYICTYLHVYIRMCVHAYILTYTYVHTYIYIYIHTYLSTYISFQILPLCSKNLLAFGRLWAHFLSRAWILWQRFVHLFLGPSWLISGSCLKSCNDRSILYHFHFNIYQSSCNSALCKLSNWMHPCVNLQEQRKRSRVSAYTT